MFSRSITAQEYITLLTRKLGFLAIKFDFKQRATDNILLFVVIP